jgi:hypothetical protein
LENSHPLAMLWAETERFEMSWGVFGRTKYAKYDTAPAALFYIQVFPDVSPATDGRVWVTQRTKGFDGIDEFNGNFEVFSDPESITSSEVNVHEVYVIGTQHTKSALKA